MPVEYFMNKRRSCDTGLVANGILESVCGLYADDWLELEMWYSVRVLIALFHFLHRGDAGRSRESCVHSNYVHLHSLRHLYCDKFQGNSTGNAGTGRRGCTGQGVLPAVACGPTSTDSC